jgi:Flp pilus assembly protein TadG
MSRIHDENAQGVIEFALIVSVMLLLFLGTVDFGRFLYYDNVINSAARVGTEVAIDQCWSPAICQSTKGLIATDDVVTQATVCEASAFLALQPSVSSCDPCELNSDSLCLAATSPCQAACLAQLCQKDVCISPLGTRTDQTNVTVTVGYKFRPISFLMNQFFSTHACYIGDPASNDHTICASSQGRVY